MEDTFLLCSPIQQADFRSTQFESLRSCHLKPHHHALLQSRAGLWIRNLTQYVIQQHLELFHLISHRCPSFIATNLRLNSVRARITLVRTVPSGIPIASATSRDVISSTEDNTSGCRSSSGNPSISRLSTARSSSSTTLCSGDPPLAVNCISATSVMRSTAFCR